MPCCITYVYVPTCLEQNSKVKHLFEENHFFLLELTTNYFTIVTCVMKNMTVSYNVADYCDARFLHCEASDSSVTLIDVIMGAAEIFQGGGRGKSTDT